jgi:hypothetical protein
MNHPFLLVMLAQSHREDRLAAAELSRTVPAAWDAAASTRFWWPVPDWFRAGRRVRVGVGRSVVTRNP